MDANWRREAIVEILRQRGKVRAKELAERFQVTRQTIYHDVEVLSLHYDLCTEPGRNGGIYLFVRKEVLVASHAMTLEVSRCVDFTFAHTSDGPVHLGL